MTLYVHHRIVVVPICGIHERVCEKGRRMHAPFIALPVLVSNFEQSAKRKLLLYVHENPTHCHGSIELYVCEWFQICLSRVIIRV